MFDCNFDNGEYYVFDKDLANYILKNKNPLNRPIRKGDLNKIVSALNNGNWREAIDDPIRFYYDGNLADGQHRLLAVVKTGKPIRARVVTGLSKEDGLAIDKGASRSARDSFLISEKEGIYLDRMVLTVVRLWFIIYKNCKSVNEFDIEEFIYNHKCDLEFVIKCHSILYKRGGSSIRYRSSGLLLKILEAKIFGIPEETLLSFCEVLNSGMYADQLNRSPEKNTSALVARSQAVIDKDHFRKIAYGTGGNVLCYKYFDKPIYDYWKGNPRKRPYSVNEYTEYFTNYIEMGGSVV